MEDDRYSESPGSVPKTNILTFINYLTSSSHSAVERGIPFLDKVCFTAFEKDAPSALTSLSKL